MPINSYYTNSPECSLKEFMEICSVLTSSWQQLYHQTLVQRLHESDPITTIRFCWFLLDSVTQHLCFLRNTLCIDELNCSREVINNFHMAHYVAHYNPHIVRVSRFQRKPFKNKNWTILSPK